MSIALSRSSYRWKPPRALSVDLLTRQRDKTTNGEARYDLLAWIGKGKHAHLDLGLKVVGIPIWFVISSDVHAQSHLRLTFFDSTSLLLHSASQERLAEFIIDSERNLSFVRWRDDKFCANHLAQVRRTLAQQKDPITWANVSLTLSPDCSMRSTRVGRSLIHERFLATRSGPVGIVGSCISSAHPGSGIAFLYNFRNAAILSAITPDEPRLSVR